jgi:hypothetical protein
MEILTTTITFLLLIALIVSPSFIIFGLNKLNLKYKFLLYLFSGIIITSILTFLLAFWSDWSNKILLSHYGYDFDAMNDVERYRNVTKENLGKVKGLEISMMGIGWPLKAFMVYIVYSPYLLIVYLATYFYKKNKAKKEQEFLSEN